MFKRKLFMYEKVRCRLLFWLTENLNYENIDQIFYAIDMVKKFYFTYYNHSIYLNVW